LVGIQICLKTHASLANFDIIFGNTFGPPCTVRYVRASQLRDTDCLFFKNIPRNNWHRTWERRNTITVL